jgi:hypothetical protein
MKDAIELLNNNPKVAALNDDIIDESGTTPNSDSVHPLESGNEVDLKRGWIQLSATQRMYF